MKRTTPLLLMMIMFAMLLVSWSNLLKYPGKEEKEYQGYLKAAKAYEEKEIYIDAAAQYEKALSMRPHEYTIAQRLMELYAEDNLNVVAKYLEACKKANKADPKQEEPYDRLLEYYRNHTITTSEYELLITAREKTGNQKYVERLIELRGQYTEGAQTEHYLTRFHPYKENVFAVAEDDELLYLVDGEGNTVLSGAYEKMGFYSDRVIAVCKDGEWYYVSQEGHRKLVPDHKADYLGTFGNGYTPALIDGKYGYLNKKMKEFHFEYDFAGCFANGVAAVKKNGTWKVINTSFKSVVEASFEDVLVDSEGYCSTYGVFIAKKSGKYYVYNTSGKCLSAGFDDAKMFVSSQPAAVKIGDKWGYVSKEGKTVCEPKFENADSYAAGYAPYCENGLWGVLDIDYNKVVEAQFDSMQPFETDATASVVRDSVERIIRMKIKW